MAAARALALGWVLFLAQGVAAQTQPSPPGADELEVITIVATKLPRPLAEVAGTASVIDAERLRRTLALDLRESMRYETGVSLVTDAARFGAQSYNIRGIEGNRVAIEIDGVPVSQAFAVGSFASAGRGYVDPQVLERIEILRGPASTLYGSDALGGIVAYATKSPASYLDDRAGAVALNAGYYGQDESAYATLALARKLAPFDALLLYSRRDGHENDNETRSDRGDANPEDYRSESWIGKLVRRGARGELRLTADLNSAASATDVRSAIRGPGKLATTTALLADDDYRRARFSLEEDRQLGGEWADALTWRLYHQRSDTDQHTEQTRDPDPVTPYPTLRQRDFEYEREVDGAGLDFTRARQGRHALHRLLYGLRFAQTQVTEQRDGLEIDLQDGDTTKVILGENLPVRDFPETHVRELAFYAHDEIDGPGAWTLIPGLRFEHYSLDPQNDPAFAQDNPDFEPVSLREQSLSPKLGALRALGGGWSVFGQYARGFRSPPVEDVNLGFTIPAFNFLALPNPDLKPETSDGIELGVRHAGPGLALSVVGYYSRYRNLIESRANLGPDPDTGALVFQSVNRARASIYGLEYRGDLLLGASERWRLRSGLAFGIGTDEERDLPLNSIDPARLILGLAYDTPDGRWQAELTTTLAAAKHRVDTSTAALFAPPGYTVVDLRLHRKLSPRASLDLGLFNLTDEHYWTWGDVRGVLAEDPLLDLYTRPGFNAAASLHYRM